MWQGKRCPLVRSSACSSAPNCTCYLLSASRMAGRVVWPCIVLCSVHKKHEPCSAHTYTQSVQQHAHTHIHLLQVTSFVLAMARTITDVPLLVVKSNSAGNATSFCAGLQCSIAVASLNVHELVHIHMCVYICLLQTCCVLKLPAMQLIWP